ncbi:MAG TPA: response regulator transcription factor [Mucilaginibacter sp.]|jgi:DNA-binding NarL/FixJ family response regulator|nr:response regulator transcription factor [Mucilaginibacter sp.]
MKSTSIVIIEDDEVLRNAYTTLIDDVEGFHVVNSYASFEDASKSIANDNPTVVMLDIELPGTNGIEAILWIKKKLPKSYVIMLTVYESEEQIFNALSNGASGYLTKNSSIAKIIDSIREVCEGGGPMSTNVARMVIKSFQKNQQSPLSKRETQILEMVSEGKSRSQIANDLFIDSETVKTHIKNVYVKLDVNSKADAIKAARKDKLI